MSRPPLLDRRAFAAGAVIATTLPLLGCSGNARRLTSPPRYPPLLDHLVWLAGDLDAACARFEAMSGIAPRYGGRHAGGTHNALVALGPACYLEIAAPQPGVAGNHPWIAAAMARPEPHLYAYCMRSVETLEALARRAGVAGLRALGPAPGTRALPDGREVRWRLLIPLVPGSGGAIPFFIDWLGSPHPAADAPGGAELTHLAIHHPEPMRIGQSLALLSPGLRAEMAERPSLTAHIVSPRGTVILSG